MRNNLEANRGQIMGRYEKTLRPRRAKVMRRKRTLSVQNAANRAVTAIKKVTRIGVDCVTLHGLMRGDFGDIPWPTIPISHLSLIGVSNLRKAIRDSTVARQANRQLERAWLLWQDLRSKQTLRCC